MEGGLRDRERCSGSGSPRSRGSRRQPGHPLPAWHTVLPPKAPELWTKVTAPAAQRTCDHLSTAELEQATQSGHCAKHTGPLAKSRPIPSLPDLCGTLTFRGLRLGMVLSHGPGEEGLL